MLKGYKTYIAGGVAVLTAVAAYVTGEATAIEAAQLAFTGVIGVLLRSGIRPA